MVVQVLLNNTVDKDAKGKVGGGVTAKACGEGNSIVEGDTRIKLSNLC